VDEIHNLNIATCVGAEASDTLKYSSERILPPSSSPGSTSSAQGSG
jgi:hypothetical protein